MLAKRIIPCLDVKEGRVVKGVKFENLRDAGDPVELAARYNAEGADELVVLDIAAARDNRPTFLETIRRVAEQLAIPLSAGSASSSFLQASSPPAEAPIPTTTNLSPSRSNCFASTSWWSREAGRET